MWRTRCERSCAPRPKVAFRWTFWTAKKRRNRAKRPPKTADLPVGRIAGAFGISGELKFDPTNAGRPALLKGAQLRCEYAGESRTVTILSLRPHKGRLLIRIEGVDSADAAQALTGAVLLAPRERIPLEPGEYFDEDLTGCAVVNTSGEPYGTVDRVEHYPASDMLVVGGRMVPMVSAIVREIDPAARRIVIDPPAGLLDGEPF